MACLGPQEYRLSLCVLLLPFSLKSGCTRVLFLELAFMKHFLKDAAALQVADEPQWESVTLAQSVGNGPIL